MFGYFDVQIHLSFKGKYFFPEYLLDVYINRLCHLYHALGTGETSLHKGTLKYSIFIVFDPQEVNVVSLALECL